MPQTRVLVLEQLIDAEPVATPDLSNVTNLPVSTVRLVAEDLTAIGLVGRSGAGSGLHWSLTSDGVNTTKALAIGKDTPNTEPRRGIYLLPLSPPLSRHFMFLRGRREPEPADPVRRARMPP